MTFYQRNVDNLEIFRPLLFSDLNDYNDNFTIQEHILSIIKDEIIYTKYVQAMAIKFGYYMDIDSPYFLGFGSAAITYKVEKEGKIYVLKFYWGFDNDNFFIKELNGYRKAKKLKPFIINYYEAYYNLEENKGILILDYAGITLSKFFLTNPSKSRIRSICRQLNNLRALMDSEKIYHNDLHSENIMIKIVDSFTRVSIIDLEEVEDHPTSEFSKFTDIIKKYCK